MACRSPRPEATQEKTLIPLKESCEQCGQPLWVARHNHRTITTLSGVWKLTLVVRQCIELTCPCFHQRFHPEEEGSWALPHGEFGLEVIALIGQWRYREHRSVPAMHQMLMARGISIAQCSVTHLMQRYEELVTLRITDHERRATGRRGAIPGVVVRGSVRLIAVVATRQHLYSAQDLRPGDYPRWRELRAQLQQSEETRRLQFRFRKDPPAYLAALEAQLLM